MRILTAILFLASLRGQSLSEDTIRIGEFNTSSTVAALLGNASAQTFEQIIPADQPIEWSVHVPKSYESKVPPGILVFISPHDSGKIPNEWKPIMERRNLIWIGANRSGNKIVTSLRMTYALLAPLAIGENYQVDADRVYVSGFSGGGRVSSMVATEYPHVFKGAIFNCGANFWGNQKPKHYAEITKNHYVFITGAKDINLRDTKKDPFV